MYDFTKTIGGDDIDQTNIVPTGTEPHDFEPTASDMAKLSEADILYITARNGKLGGQNNRNTSAERKSYMHIGTDTDRRKRSAYFLVRRMQNCKCRQYATCCQRWTAKCTELYKQT